MRKLTIIALMLGLSLSINAQKRLAPAARMAVKEASVQTVRAYIMYNGDVDWAAISATGAVVNSTTGGIATVTVPLSALEQLAEVRGVTYVQTASAVVPQMNEARKDAGVDDVHSGTTLPQGFTGKGVVLGIVDSGIDYTHPAFKDKDGKLRIMRVWEQGTKSSSLGKTPQDGYGTEYTTEANILASHGDVNGGSHGTHVLGIAAGSPAALTGSSATVADRYQGIATEAELVVVALDPVSSTGENNVAVSDAIGYIYRYATEVGKPCVINLSLGAHEGPHDGTSLFDRMADEMQGPGRLLVGASGNYGGFKFHVARHFDGTDTTPLQTFFDYKKTLSTLNAGGNVEIWAEKDMNLSVELFSYNTYNHTMRDSVCVYTFEKGAETNSDGAPQEVKLNSVTGAYTVSSEVSPLNGKQHIVIKSGVTGFRSNYAAGIRIKSNDSGQVDMWGDHTYIEFTSRGEEGFTETTNESTVTEIGGTGKRIITVGAYCTRNFYKLYGESTERDAQEKVGELLSFSGYGPTADGRTKPDITAPGGVIVSSVSGLDISGNILKAAEVQYRNSSYAYGYMHGTSMSSPFVTGTLALWLEACPTLTPEQVREVLSQTARSATDNGRWGYGKVDVMAGMQAIVSLAGVEEVKSEECRVKNLSYYNLMGQRISGMSNEELGIRNYDYPSKKKGIIIHNGRKYVR